MHGNANQWLPVVCHGTVGKGEGVKRDIFWSNPEIDLPLVSSPRIVATLLAMLLPVVAGGQMMSPTMSDATVVARGSFRFRGLVEWTRVDGVLTPGAGLAPLGGALTMDLDASSLPLLEPAKLAAQSLSRAPVSLNVGRLSASADSRIATVPISLEYGLTSRITIGMNIPIVQTRTVVTAQLNGRADSSANVGVNPAGFLFASSAFASNAQVTSGLDAATAQLIQQKQTCTASPTTGNCPAFNARMAEVNALIADAGAFSDAATDLYGISASQPGAPFIPLAGGVIQKAIDSHLAELRTSFTSFGINGGSGSLVAAKGLAANSQLQQLVNDEAFGIGLDSIGTTETIALGDIELLATSQLFNSFSDSLSGGLKWRGSVTGVVRLGTGHRARENRPLEIGTGDGQTDVEVRGAVDLLVGRRLLTTVAATYTQQLGSITYERLPYAPGLAFILTDPTPGTIKPGNMAAIRINPRWMVTRGLMLGGLFMTSHRGADQTTLTLTSSLPDTYFGKASSINTTAAGLTLSYSNLATRAGTGDAKFPAELHFSHLETLGVNGGGAVKTSRDAVELRLYFRTRR